MEDSRFTWIDFYTSFAEVLGSYKNNRRALTEKLCAVSRKAGIKFPGTNGGILTDIDPFTVYSMFNNEDVEKDDEKRKAIISALISEFDISAKAPEDFTGIPMDMSHTAFVFGNVSRNESINSLWTVFESALALANADTPENKEAFCNAYDSALAQYAVRWNLSTNLSWIRPKKFLALDSCSQSFMKNPDNMPADITIKISSFGNTAPSGEKYLALCDECTDVLSKGKYPYKIFPELYYNARIASSEGSQTQKQEKYVLIITADRISSTEDGFTMDDINLGDRHAPLDIYFKDAAGNVIRRAYSKGERKNCNKTIPRLTFQLFEEKIARLSVEEKENFPVCQYNPESPMIRGIYTSVEEFKEHTSKTWEYAAYTYDNGRMFVVHCWNLFSDLTFVRECLTRFGKPGDEFVIIYRKKAEREEQEEKQEEEQVQALEENSEAAAGPEKQVIRYLNPYSDILIKSGNIIFHGAPGTGKTYLAKQIAADIISNGYYEDFDMLSAEQKEQMEFVQFHPSYDYTDFVEGLRPVVKDDGSMGFELKDGTFKRFIGRARKNYENSIKPKEMRENEVSVQNAMNDFFTNLKFGVDEFSTLSGSRFTVTSINDKHVNIYIPGDYAVNDLALSIDNLRRMLESDARFNKIRDVTSFFGREFATRADSYYYAIYKEIKAKEGSKKASGSEPEPRKNYIFIIDEINRGEISRIFGELFFSIDPGYRGTKGAVSTQYANMHDNPGDKFYIPENVYIIGTMNDIDRSVDSFDFAMRRRFRFIELKADEQTEMLSALPDELKDEAIRRMERLNKEIAATEGLNDGYQIGASYFMKLKSVSFDTLWTDYLKPLLMEYIRGMYDEEASMKRFEEAYGYKAESGGALDESSQSQG